MPHRHFDTFRKTLGLRGTFFAMTKFGLPLALFQFMLFTPLRQKNRAQTHRLTGFFGLAVAKIHVELHFNGNWTLYKKCQRGTFSKWPLPPRILYFIFPEWLCTPPHRHFCEFFLKRTASRHNSAPYFKNSTTLLIVVLNIAYVGLYKLLRPDACLMTKGPSCPQAKSSFVTLQLAQKRFVTKRRTK